MNAKARMSPGFCFVMRNEGASATNCHPERGRSSHRNCHPELARFPSNYHPERGRAALARWSRRTGGSSRATTSFPCRQTAGPSTAFRSLRELHSAQDDNSWEGVATIGMMSLLLGGCHCYRVVAGTASPVRMTIR